jgi:hypothetical protein
MTGSEWSHLILAVACLIVGCLAILFIMPLLAFTVFFLGGGMIGLYILVRLWPSSRSEESDGPEEEE